MLIKALILIGWIVCGFLAYGLIKEHKKHFYRPLEYIGYNKVDEVICWVCGIAGCLGLIFALFDCLMEQRTLILCLKMPEELKQGYGERTE